ncbi:hypothetical protein EVAR_43846_1 [Eumeta japonica]|uniref:Uncharacterized protein n=1 Tax=Eumeta variegata TaxID=151549 RepID=A0A4C1WYS3_EUMVA|nr:hypothetical protein EVAR_43846_1 [Eumeta japonica]
MKGGRGFSCMLFCDWLFTEIADRAAFEIRTEAGTLFEHAPIGMFNTCSENRFALFVSDLGVEINHRFNAAGARAAACQEGRLEHALLMTDAIE